MQPSSHFCSYANKQAITPISSTEVDFTYELVFLSLFFIIREIIHNSRFKRQLNTKNTSHMNI